VGMEHVGGADGMGERFESVVKLPHAGLIGYTVRVLPSHPLLASSAELARIVLPG
jgi:starch phosphorylase